MCHYLFEQGECPFGEYCTYAHSESELRFIERHPKHKTLPCRDFSTVGFCPFGERCSFIHYKTDPTAIPKPTLQRSITGGAFAAGSALKVKVELLGEGSWSMGSILQESKANLDLLRLPVVSYTNSSGYAGSMTSSTSPSSRSRCSLSLSRCSSTSDVSDVCGPLLQPAAEEDCPAQRLPVFRNLTERRSTALRQPWASATSLPSPSDAYSKQI